MAADSIVRYRLPSVSLALDRLVLGLILPLFHFIVSVVRPFYVPRLHHHLGRSPIDIFLEARPRHGDYAFATRAVGRGRRCSEII